MDLLGLERKSQELSRFYKQRVLRSSFYDAMGVVILDKAEIDFDGWKQLTDVSGDGKSIINLSTEDLDKTHFATDEDGIFAVIRGMKLYPIGRTTSDKEKLKAAQKYERCSRSTLRRVLYAPDILIKYHVICPFLKPYYELKDGLHMIGLALISSVE